VNVKDIRWTGTGTGANIVDINRTPHIISTNDPPVQQWNHLAVTYDNTSGVAQVFINGNLEVGQNLGKFISQTSYDLYIGKRPGHESRFDGLLDEICVYNRALFIAEIQKIYIEGWSVPATPQLWIPLYIYPDSRWDEVAAANSRVPFTAIINPDSGPDSGPPNFNYEIGLNTLRNGCVTILGYIHTAYGTRSLDEVKADIDLYDKYFDIHGIFVDETSSSADQLE
jgi:hypothetical protein